MRPNARSPPPSEQSRPDSQGLLLAYLYHNMADASPSVGGYAHATLLQPGGWAKRPLCDRIGRLRGQPRPAAPGLGLGASSVL